MPQVTKVLGIGCVIVSLMDVDPVRRWFEPLYIASIFINDFIYIIHEANTIRCFNRLVCFITQSVDICIFEFRYRSAHGHRYAMLETVRFLCGHSSSAWALWKFNQEGTADRPKFGRLSLCGRLGHAFLQVEDLNAPLLAQIRQ